jgi:outer membrane protein OmpA-like peptidoglycan-associated protein
MRLATFLLTACLGVLAACGSAPTAQPGSPTAAPGTAAPGSAGPTPVPPPPEPPRPTLAAEQGRLAELFRGTPVVFTMQSDGSLRVEIPLKFSFEPGSSTVKPPLAAVLDRLATSQRKGTSRLLVVAPTDKRNKVLTLGTDRAGSTRDYLVGHGIAATRFVLSAVPEPDVVRIVVSENGTPRLQ